MKSEMITTKRSHGKNRPPTNHRGEYKGRGGEREQYGETIGEKESRTTDDRAVHKKLDLLNYPPIS